MATLAYVTSFTTAGTAISAGAGDNVFVGDTASIAARSGYGLIGAYGRASIEGDLFGLNAGIYYTTTTFSSILIGKSGSVSGITYGIYASGDNNVLSSAGTIAGYYGVIENGANVRVMNSGYLQGDYIALYLGAGSGTDVVVNSGEIISPLQAIYGSTAIDKVYNTGFIAGLVNLFGGADVFDSRGGLTQGLIDLGTGNDTAFGGTGADNIFGGDDLDRLRGKQGDDRLNGGLDKDKLTGGADEDEFYFSTTLGSGNVDTITDFHHGEDTILLSSTIFSALGSSVGKSEFYIPPFGGHSATKASHHIIYDKNKGTLWYDDDGQGGNAAVKFAVLEDRPQNLTYHDFAIA